MTLHRWPQTARFVSIERKADRFAATDSSYEPAELYPGAGRSASFHGLQ